MKYYRRNGTLYSAPQATLVAWGWVFAALFTTLVGIAVAVADGPIWKVVVLLAGATVMFSYAGGYFSIADKVTKANRGGK